jgi:hypothetical protein
VTRRQALSLGGLSLLSLAVPGLALRAEPARKYRTLLWISPDGGESQLDSFDPKPNAPTEVRGPFGTIATALPGVRLSALYPRTARLLDQVALLRARHVADLNHLPAMRAMLAREGQRHLLSEHARTTTGIPPFYAETPDVLPSADYRRDAYGTNTLVLDLPWDRVSKRFRPPDVVTPDERLPQRLELLKRLDRRGSEPGQRFDELREQAVDLIRRSGPGLDLRAEDLDRYGGENPIAVGILSMRELARLGVTGSLVFRAGDWDDHYRLAENMPRRAARMDQALSALLSDLRRGLLGDALVVYASEFGRAPRLNKEGGRDHWPFCHALLCGGPVKPGVVHGWTDHRGAGQDGVVEAAAFAELVKEALAQEPDFARRSQLPKLFR